MNAQTLPSELRLAHAGIYSVDDAAGTQFTCREGTVWITLDSDPRDVVLEAGDSFTPQEHRRALVYAVAPSRISIRAAALPRPQTLPGRLQIESVLSRRHA